MKNIKYEVYHQIQEQNWKNCREKMSSITYFEKYYESYEYLYLELRDIITNQVFNNIHNIMRTKS